MDENQRDITPEPSDPLVDLHYLDGPVSRVVAFDASLRDLIEGYSVLAARLRACVTESTDIDASWPLFQPLRIQRTAFVQSLVRDLGRAMVDPLEKTYIIHEDETKTMSDMVRVPLTGLPSPKDSPRKKRGMSEEQVKYARDLCTTCHSVLKLLAVMFTLPAIYHIFTGESGRVRVIRIQLLNLNTDEQLGLILTQVLAIPLANQLPTPNARKTCALSIWLLQVQRLPAEVLEPARDRIAYALRRGIEGELGKEGKKGSASDGMKVSLFISAEEFSVKHAYRPYTISRFISPLFSFHHSRSCCPLFLPIYWHPRWLYGHKHVMHWEVLHTLLRRFRHPLCMLVYLMQR